MAANDRVTPTPSSPGSDDFEKSFCSTHSYRQLTEPELESVLAHEIGHYKKRHVVKLLSVSIAGIFMAFAAIAWLARQQWFYHAFGFDHQAGFAAINVVPAMLLFALLAGTISFWFSPLIHFWSRRFEYEADAFARAKWEMRNRLYKHSAN